MPSTPPMSTMATTVVSPTTAGARLRGHQKQTSAANHTAIPASSVWSLVGRRATRHQVWPRYGQRGSCADTQPPQHRKAVTDAPSTAGMSQAPWRFR